MIFISGCARDPVRKETEPISDIKIKTEQVGYWLDEETDTVHKIVYENGSVKVVSTVKYKNQNPLEVMRILSSRNINGKIHWVYFVPSTKYIVELTELSTSEDGINVEWKNKSARGEEKSGSDLLLRCAENGFIAGKNKNKVKEKFQPDDFSSFDKLKQVKIQ